MGCTRRRPRPPRSSYSTTAPPRGCAILLAGLAAYLIAELYPEDPAEAVATMRPVFLGLDAPRGLSPAARLPV